MPWAPGEWRQMCPKAFSGTAKRNCDGGQKSSGGVAGSNTTLRSVHCESRRWRPKMGKCGIPGSGTSENSPTQSTKQGLGVGPTLEGKSGLFKRGRIGRKGDLAA